MDASEFQTGWLGLGRRLVTARREAERLRIFCRGVPSGIIFPYFCFSENMATIWKNEKKIEKSEKYGKYMKILKNMETLGETRTTQILGECAQNVCQNSGFPASKTRLPGAAVTCYFRVEGFGSRPCSQSQVRCSSF